jgi:hypothetical protein
VHHPKFISTAIRISLKILVTASLCLAALPVRAATGGSISGAVTDKSVAVIAGAILKLVNTAQHTAYQAVSDKQGLYVFPTFPSATTI